MVSRRDVALAQSTKDFQFIKSGLRAGERIVADGTHKAIPGRKVRTADASVPAKTVK